MAALSRQGVLCGDVDFCCLICGNTFIDSTSVYEHVQSGPHLDSFAASRYVDSQAGQLVRKIKTFYFCEACNAVLASSLKVSRHVAEDAHQFNCSLDEGDVRGSSFRRVGRDVVAFDDVLILEAAWNGIVAGCCVVCDLDSDDFSEHVRGTEHVIKLIHSRVMSGVGNALFRKIDNTLIQCLTCNTTVPHSALLSHWESSEHAALLLDSRKAKRVSEANKRKTNAQNEPKTNSLKEIDNKLNKDHTPVSEVDTIDIRESKEQSAVTVNITNENRMVKGPEEINEVTGNVLKDYKKSLLAESEENPDVFTNISDGGKIITETPENQQNGLLANTFKVDFHREQNQEMKEENKVATSVMKEIEGGQFGFSVENICNHPKIKSKTVSADANASKKDMTSNKKAVKLGKLTINASCKDIANIAKPEKLNKVTKNALKDVATNNKDADQKINRVPATSSKKEVISAQNKSKFVTGEPKIKETCLHNIPKETIIPETNLTRSNMVQCSCNMMTVKFDTQSFVHVHNRNNCKLNSEDDRQEKPGAQELNTKQIQVSPYSSIPMEDFIVLAKETPKYTIVNNCFAIKFLSFLMFQDLKLFLSCIVCNQIFPWHLFEDHTLCLVHKFKMAAVPVLTLGDEFVREAVPDQFHCGFCHKLSPGWQALQEHLASAPHLQAKRAAASRLQRLRDSVAMTVGTVTLLRAYNRLQRRLL